MNKNGFSSFVWQDGGRKGGSWIVEVVGAAGIAFSSRFSSEKQAREAAQNELNKIAN